MADWRQIEIPLQKIESFLEWADHDMSLKILKEAPIDTAIFTTGKIIDAKKKDLDLIELLCKMIGVQEMFKTEHKTKKFYLLLLTIYYNFTTKENQKEFLEFVRKNKVVDPETDITIQHCVSMVELTMENNKFAVVDLLEETDELIIVRNYIITLLSHFGFPITHNPFFL